ncbi:MAG TPA: VOC family protein [Terracidiphilus sp.]
MPTDIVLPHVSYQNVVEACEWLTRVLGFTEAFRHGDPVSGIQMYLGGACLMLHRAREGCLSPAQLGYGTQMLTIIVENVDAHFRKAVQEGARIVEALHETVYGERQYGVEDIEGHRWLFSQHARDVNPAEWGATVGQIR